MSGLRDELAALHRPNGAATPRCTADGDVWPCPTIRLLDRFPPEAEGEAERIKAARKSLKKKAAEWDERSDFWEREDRSSGLHIMARQGAAAFREVRTALAASPEEQDR